MTTTARKAIRQALAILRQIREGQRRIIGWISDGSNHHSKCAIGRCVGVLPSRNGIVILVGNAKFHNRINWRISAAVAKLVLQALTAPDAEYRSLPVETVRTIVNVNRIRRGERIVSPTYSYLPPC